VEHATQLVCPVAFWNDPSAHHVHRDAPDAELYLPAGQAVQFPFDVPYPDAYVPGAHDRHTDCPTTAVYFPGEHSQHVDCASIGTCDPIAQLVHAVEDNELE
jgi:hypothetical protein